MKTSRILGDAADHPHLSRRGRTPVVRVRGRSRRRLSVAALACYKAGERLRLIYRPCPDARHDGRKSFSWKDYCDLI